MDENLEFKIHARTNPIPIELIVKNTNKQTNIGIQHPNVNVRVFSLY